MAQALGASGQRLLAGGVAGYEVGIRVGEFLGRSHYKVFHTTGTAGTLAAAAAAGHLLGLDARADAARLRLGRHAVGRALGVPARRRRFEAVAHRARGRCRPDGRVPGARRLHRCGADPRRPAGHGGGHVAGCRSAAPGRRPGLALGAGRDLVQVPRLLPPHASGGRCVARGHARERPARRRHRARHGACAPGRDRRAGPGGRSATVHQSKFSMGTVLALVARFGAGRAGRVRRAFPR